MRGDRSKSGGIASEEVLAAIVRLMEVTLIRVGNEEYARTNHSYGLTTMRNRHVQVSGFSIARCRSSIRSHSTPEGQKFPPECLLVKPPAG